MSAPSHTNLLTQAIVDVDPRLDFADAVLIGLSAHPKQLPSKYFYDDVGSDLFQKITQLEAYYPTRVELEILQARAAEIIAPLRGQPINLIDLGAGDGHKTAHLVAALLDSGQDVRYVPIDFSEAAVVGATESFGERFPGLQVDGVVSEYLAGLRWLTQQSDRTNLVLFLGSNIGNFAKPQARAFLRRLWTSLNQNDHVLVGFDLKKDIDVLLGAYNDREGVTSAFNLNLLTRINRELGGDFDLQNYRHFGTYNVFTGAMESYLVSEIAHRVHIGALHRDFLFDAWEPIHTEYSYKYLDRDINDLAGSASFTTLAKYYDEARWFCDALLRVERG